MWEGPYLYSVRKRDWGQFITKYNTVLFEICFFFFFPNNRSLFLTVVEAGSLRSRCLQGWFPLRPLCSLHMNVLLPSLPMVNFLCSFTRGYPLCVLISSYKDTSKIEVGPTLTTSF